MVHNIIAASHPPPPTSLLQLNLILTTFVELCPKTLINSMYIMAKEQNYISPSLKIIEFVPKEMIASSPYTETDNEENLF